MMNIAQFSIEYWSLLFLPCFFWGAYHYYKDRHKPEPLWMLLLALGLGYGSAYIGLAFYRGLDLVGLNYDAYALASQSTWALFLYAVLAIGPIEELAKFLSFIIIITRLRHFDEPIDGIIYASFIGLGFALHESQFYLPFVSEKEALARALAAPIVHALFASIWGYAYGFAQHHKTHRTLATGIGLTVSMLLHGIYDFFSIGLSIWANIAPPLMILVIWLLRMRAIRRYTKGLEGGK